MFPFTLTPPSSPPFPSSCFPSVSTLVPFGFVLLPLPLCPEMSLAHLGVGEEIFICNSPLDVVKEHPVCRWGWGEAGLRLLNGAGSPHGDYKSEPTCTQKAQSPALCPASAESGNTDPTCCRSDSPSRQLSSRLLFLSPLPFFLLFFYFCPMSHVSPWSLFSSSFFLLIRNYITPLPNVTLHDKSQKQCRDCTPRSPPLSDEDTGVWVGRDGENVGSLPRS